MSAQEKKFASHYGSSRTGLSSVEVHGILDPALSLFGGGARHVEYLDIEHCSRSLPWAPVQRGEMSHFCTSTAPWENLTWSQGFQFWIASPDFSVSPSPTLWGPKEKEHSNCNSSLAQVCNRYLRDISWMNGWASIVYYTQSNSSICSRNI